MVISKFDECSHPNKDEAKKIIIEQFKAEKIDKIIFSCKDTPDVEIANFMHL